MFYQVNYFINGLLPTLIGQTVMNNLQNLNEAVERAKAVEVGVQYTLNYGYANKQSNLK